MFRQDYRINKIFGFLQLHLEAVKKNQVNPVNPVGKYFKVLDLKPDLEYHVYESYYHGNAPENRALILTARDMNRRERIRYEKK